MASLVVAAIERVAPLQQKWLGRDKYQVDGRGGAPQPPPLQVVVRSKTQREMHYFSSPNGQAHPAQSGSSQQQQNNGTKLVAVTETNI